MKRLLVLTLCSVCLSATIFFFKKRTPTTMRSVEGLVIPKGWLAVNKSPLTPQHDVRPADQTFLTFPEWFLVFSPVEQANYFKQHTATSFPFMRHTAQIWESYRIMNDQIRGNFPTNTGYHFMIWVIGSSASAEYSIKAWYETIIGRLTDTKQPVTDEDKLNAAFTQDYVDFIKDEPWYKFNFKRHLKTLWTSTPLYGNHFLRKLDRRYILTSELLVKIAYGKLIGLGTQTVYDEALPTTAVVIDLANAKDTAYQAAKLYPGQLRLLYLPRYDKFSSAISALARTKCRFKEIAGNNSAILLSVIMPANDATDFKNTRTVFTQSITADPAFKRIVLAVPVPLLHTLLSQIADQNIPVEHVFDY